MVDVCRFCNIINNKIRKYDEIDKPILEGEKYFSIVSIGAFVKGWTLVVSKEHKYNLSRDYSDNVFFEYLKKHIMKIRTKLDWTDRIVVFEHGANACDSETACGTSHAHLHVLPMEESILEEITNEREWIMCKWGEVADIVGDNEYLLYCDKAEMGMEADVYIHVVFTPESQYFRRVIFDKLGLDGNYSYKKDARYEESLQIRKLLEE